MEDLRIKKKRRIQDKDADADRISKLSDDLIHQIMFYLDARLAVQTSVLSKRWKLVWTTLPFLNFNGYVKHYCRNKLSCYKFLNNFLSFRNHQCQILKLDLNPRKGMSKRLLRKFVRYAISHNVERLNVRSEHYCSLDVLNSNLLKELKLTMKFGRDFFRESDCWTLPNLTTLHLEPFNRSVRHRFPESCLIWLPALTTLGLNRCVLLHSFRLPALKTLCLESCTLPQNVWDLPALLTLELTSVSFPKDMSEYFFALVSLRNLTIDFGKLKIGCCDISSSQLVNLKIKAYLNTVNASKGEIVVWAPKLCNFNAIGFFRTTIKHSKLNNVNVKFWDKTMYRRKAPSWVLKKHQDLFQIMFSGLGKAKILSVDLVTLQALSEISDIVAHLNSPFYNLKYLRLPHKCKKSCISRSVREYLLGGSPSATIVKT